MSFGKVKPKIGGRDYLRLEEVIELCDLPGDEWVTVRFLPTNIVSMKNHWIKIRTKTNKEVNLPRLCLSHSLDGSNTPRLDENGEAIECPYCTLQHGNRESGAPANASANFYANAIVREIQEDEPRKKAKHSRSEEKTGFKEVKSKSWTPVRMVRLTNTMVARIQEIGENNRAKNKKTGKTVAYDVTDAKYGIDLRIKYKPKASGSDKYTIDADGSERTPLTEEEKAYLTFNIDETVMGLIGLRTPAEAEEDFKSLNVVGGDVPLDEDDDDGYSLGGDDDDEDEKPRKKKRRAAFDDDDGGDDEDEKPRKKKRSSAFDDEDEDEKPRKKKRKSEDDEPVRKKKRKSDDEPVRKKKRKVVDDEDEAPKRKKKRRPAFD